jgi:hypothetical protein
MRRALGWHLLSCKGKAEMDAQQWEQDATEKQQKVAELEQEVQKVQQELEQQLSSFKVWHNICCSVLERCATVSAHTYAYKPDQQLPLRLH